MQFPHVLSSIMQLCPVLSLSLSIWFQDFLNDPSFFLSPSLAYKREKKVSSFIGFLLLFYGKVLNFINYLICSLCLSILYSNHHHVIIKRQRRQMKIKEQQHTIKEEYKMMHSNSIFEELKAKPLDSINLYVIIIFPS